MNKIKVPIFTVDFTSLRREKMKAHADAIIKALITGHPVERKENVAIDVVQLHQAKGSPVAHLFAKVVVECRNCPMMTTYQDMGASFKYCAPLTMYAKYPEGWDRMGILAECPLPPAKDAIFVEDDQPITKG